MTFNEQILRWRDEFIENINKTKKTKYTWETLPKKEKEDCHKFVVKKANEDPIRPHGFGKRMISFMVRFILFDPMHANHNHGKYNMCSTF